MKTIVIISTAVLSFFSLLGVIIVAQKFGFSPRSFHDPAMTFDPLTMVTAISVMVVPVGFFMRARFHFLSITILLTGCMSFTQPSRVQNLESVSFVVNFESHDAVEISVSVPGSVRIFRAPEDYGGAPVFTKYLSQVTAVDDAGRTLSVQIKGSQVLVDSSSSKSYTLKYVYKVPQKISGEIDQSLPNLDERYGRIDNNTFLLAPEGVADKPAHLSLKAPKHWRIVTGWGEGTEFKIEKVSELLSGMIALGDFVYSKEKIDGLDVTYAIKGNYSHDLIKKQFARVLKSQIEIAGPLSITHFLVVFQPTKNSCCKGTSLTNSLVVNIPADEKLEPFNMRVIGTISHELFHQWNFKSVYPASEDGAYLFSEGFTNYFAVASLVRAELIPPESFGWFLWNYRNLLEKNPKYQGADFAKIQSGFKTNDADLVDLAYTKGPFVAVLLDLTLREDTSGRESVTTWFRKLVERFGGKKGYTVKDLRDLVLELSEKPNGKAVAAFDDYFIGAKPIPAKALINQLGISCVEKTKKCSLKKISNQSSRTMLFSADGAAKQ